MAITVAISSPAREMCHSRWAFDMATLIGYTVAVRPDIRIVSNTSLGTLIVDQRVDLALEAQKSKCDYILWMDNDMRFPKDALIRLLNHKKDIVAANYVTRELPPVPISFNITDDKWVRIRTKTDSKGLEKVNGTGMGLMLTSMKVFEKMPRPWFHIGYSTVNHKFLGEDILFCMRAEKLGYETFIDHDLSKQVSHIGSLEFRHEHVEDDEEIDRMTEIAHKVEAEKVAAAGV